MLTAFLAWSVLDLGLLGTVKVESPMPIQSSVLSLDMYDCMRWRCIGPHRGGRTVGASGVPQQPNVFYIGVNNGGVWKSNDYGNTWKPIFDDQPTGSIGNLAVAPSDPNVVYVGSGEGLLRPDLSVGNGMYRSGDAGKTWTHLGLRDAQQINTIVVDPKNPDRLFVAVLGHPYGPNEERGIYRSVNGGKSFERVLYRDADTGGITVGFDPKNANTVYAAMWAARLGPWENSEWSGPGSGLFKSTDGGSTWRQLTIGLPGSEQGLGRIGFDISRTQPNTIYVTLDARQGGGIYRSDDAGESFALVNSDRRLWGRPGDFAAISVHPKNPDIVFFSNIAMYRSDDGGKTTTCIRGAPGGDDYHALWINPDNPDIMLSAADQGAIVTVNGGETWSSWYNQPTAQFYHVSTDNEFPYNVYGGQQESGSVGISSRGNDGQITFRDWHPVGVEEYGYVAADPLDSNIVYGGKITRYDKRTGAVQNVRPPQARTLGARFIRTAPVLFSPVDKKSLFFAGNYLFKTMDGAKTWEVISPDLTRTVAPAPIGSVFEPPQRRGVIYAVAPSNHRVDTIWAGTDDGLIHITRDGGKGWDNITPPELTPWSKVSQLDAGRFSEDTCYVAINRIRLDDQKPHIYRTHDGGKTWKRIVKGLPDDPINAVREDPHVKGLLYCGSERMVHFSLDDGENWHPLRLNMPCTSIRDLVIHEADLVVGTHGRSFWILDNITPLRQLAALLGGSPPTVPVLYRPAVTYQVEWNRNTDTPLPPEEPAGQNPPDGAMIDYYLPTEAEVVTIEILGSAGELIRRFSSEDKPELIDWDQLAVPKYWYRTPSMVGKMKGSHRFVWDLRLAPPEGRRSFPIAAIYRNTASNPKGARVPTGIYTVRLTVGTFVQEYPLTIRPDPRFGTDIEEDEESWH